MANRAKPARDGIYPEGAISFSYDGEPLDGFSELAHGRATITSPTTLRAANKSRRSIFVKVTSGSDFAIGGTGASKTNAFSVGNGDVVTIGRAADGAIFCDATNATIEWFEELVKQP